MKSPFESCFSSILSPTENHPRWGTHSSSVSQTTFHSLFKWCPLQEERAHWKEVWEATKRWNSAGADDKKQDRCHAREKSMFLSPSPSLQASDSCNCPLAVSAPTYLLPSFSLKCRGLASALQAAEGRPFRCCVDSQPIFLSTGFTLQLATTSWETDSLEILTSPSLLKTWSFEVFRDLSDNPRDTREHTAECPAFSLHNSHLVIFGFQNTRRPCL